MDESTAKLVRGLIDMNKALTAGLEGAITFMESWNDIDSESHEKMIESLKKLVDQSRSIFGSDIKAEEP